MNNRSRLVNFKKFFFFIVSFFFWVFHSSAQCGKNGFTTTEPQLDIWFCSTKQYTTTSSGAVKIPINKLGIDNEFSFSTVGWTTEDTYLELYDGNGILLASNDNDSACGGCTQSTLVYTNSTGALIETPTPYLIISKKGCLPLDAGISFWYNVDNVYDSPPTIVTQATDLMGKCVNDLVDFEATNMSHLTPANIDPWSSSDPLVLSIDRDTGMGQIHKSGAVIITATGGLMGNCEVKKRYVIKLEAETSPITTN